MGGVDHTVTNVLNLAFDEFAAETFLNENHVTHIHLLKRSIFVHKSAETQLLKKRLCSYPSSALNICQQFLRNRKWASRNLTSGSMAQGNSS